MKKIITVLSIIMVLLIPLVACKPSFEQKRTEVVEYLTTFTKIDNALWESSYQTVNFTKLNQIINGITDFTKIDNALWESIYQTVNFTKLDQSITGITNAVQQTNSLKAPNIREANIHLQSYKQLLQNMLAWVQKVQTALSSGNEPSINQLKPELITMPQQLSSLNRSTEALMLKYNITYSEVNYKPRGK